MSTIFDLIKKYSDKAKEIIEKNELSKTNNAENSADKISSENKEKPNAQTASLSREQEAMSKIAALQKEFDDTTLASTKKLDLQRMNYEAPTDDELMSEAKRSLESKYSAKRADAVGSSDTKKKNLEEALAAISDSVASEKQATDENYKKAVAEAENSALKRGVARSSMTQGAVNELIKENLDKRNAIDEAAKVKSAELSDALSAIENELYSVLSSIDSEEASAVASAFDKLKEESEKKAEDVLKYNNTLDEKEAEYARKTYDLKTEEELEKLKNDYDYKKLGVALDYYLSIADPEKALNDFLKNAGLSDYLGNYYDYLRTILKNRAKQSGAANSSGSIGGGKVNEIM